MAERRETGPIPALLVLLGLPLLLLAPALFGDRALVGVHTGGLSPWRAALPDAFAQAAAAESLSLYADKTIQFQPLLAASLERLGAGEVPLWNPHNLLGVPLLAQAFPAALYPPAWLALALPWELAFAWLTWLQAALAGLGTAWLLRALGLGWTSAALGGCTYMLSGYLSARWHWYQIHGCSAWLPLTLWGLERHVALARQDDGGSAGERWWATAAVSSSLACALLTGWIQGAVHAIYLGATWTVARCLHGASAADPAARRRRVGAALHAGLAVLLGLALAGPQLLPTLEYVGSGASARAVEPPSVVRSVAMDPAGLTTFVTPDLFGHPRDLRQHPLPLLNTRGALRQAVYEPDDIDNFVEGSGSFGLAALLLAVLGAARRRTGRNLALGCLIAGPLLAIDTPLLEVAARLPGLASGDPQRFLLLSSIGGALLAGFGMQRLLDEGPPRWFLSLAAGALLLALAPWSWSLAQDTASWSDWLAGPLATHTGIARAEILAHADELAYDLGLLRASLARAVATLALLAAGLWLARRRRGAGLALVLLVCVGDQALTGWRNLTTVPEGHLFEAPPGLDALRGDGSGRLVRAHPLGAAAGLGVPLPPNLGAPQQIPDLGGYFGLAPMRSVALFEALEPGSTGAAAESTGGGLGMLAFHPGLMDHPALDVLAVDRVLAPQGVIPAGAVDPTPIGDAVLWRRPTALPRAWITTAAPVADVDTARARLVARGWDPRGPAWLEPAADGRPAPDQEPWPADLARPTVRLEDVTPEHVRLSVDTPREGVVVLADTWMPGWSATLDSRPAPLHPAHAALRAVIVPPGAHVIELRYRSPAWNLGLATSAAALLVLLALGLLTRRR